MTGSDNDIVKSLTLPEYLDGKSLADELTNHAVARRFTESDDRHVTMGLLHAYANDPQVQLTEKQWLEVRHDERLQSLLDAFQARLQIASFPRLAAASSSNVHSRTSESFKIDISTSEQSQDSSVVAITKTPAYKGADPVILFLRHSDSTQAKISLPEFRNDRAVFLILNGDPAYSLLLDPEVEVSLA